MVNGEMITRLLEEKGVTQKAMAASIGASETMVSFIISGLREPSLTNLSRIAHVLGCKTSELIID